MEHDLVIMKSSPTGPETLQTSAPTTTESPPLHVSPVENHPALSAERAAALHRVQWRRGFSPLGANRRNTPIVRLREHQTHGRGS
jgi:hypothetical protein